MTPAGRFSALVELLSRIAAGTRTAEAEVQAWFRGRRFAGSKDRRWISDHVFEILRRQGELDWAAQTLGLTAGPRPRALLALLLFDVLPEDDLHAYFGGQFGDAPLNADEMAAVRAFDKAALYDAMPDPARGNYPEWMQGPLEAVFGEGLIEEMTALARPARLNLRVNSLKADRKTVLAGLEKADIAAIPAAFSPDGIYVQGRHNITASPLYRDGLVEIQDEAAQISARLVDALPGMLVVDYCAGGGGKSLAMAATMNNKGQIHAFDISARRMGDIAARAKRAGVDIIQTHISADGAGASTGLSFEGQAARVLVDAPCSGSGTWRRQPDQKWRLSEVELVEYSALQTEILDRAAALVASGGRLIYATCSLFAIENAAVIKAFCNNHPEFSLLDISGLWSKLGLGGSYDGQMLQLTPYRHGCDGFFTAILERQA